MAEMRIILDETDIGDIFSLSVYEDTKEERILVNLLGAEVSSILVLEPREWQKFCSVIDKASREKLDSELVSKKSIEELSVSLALKSLAEDYAQRKCSEKEKEIVEAVSRNPEVDNPYAVAKAQVKKTKKKKKKNPAASLAKKVLKKVRE